MGSEYVRAVEVSADVPQLGRQLLYDDMEDQFKWTTSGTGADWTADKFAAAAFNGSSGMRLKTRVTDPAEDDVVMAQRYFPRTPIKKYQFKCHWLNPGGATLKHLQVDFSLQYSAIVSSPAFRWVKSTGGVWIRDLAGWQQITDLTQTLSDNSINRFAVSFDINQGLWLKIALNDLEADISSYDLLQAEAVFSQYCQLSLTVFAAGAAAAMAYLDDILVEEH